ncbi:MAG TPA: EGF domain-containing protein [Polyangia bacterium]|nr:EGF domain-containing protein [Polyangia bacterium]
MTCTSASGSVTCGACPTGYTGTGATSCTDINECLTNNGGCDPLTTCTNTAGSRTCGACPTGYTGSGATSCTDVNECLTNNGGCDPLATCTNTAGSRTCGACPTGYTGTGATSCTDINECLTNNGGCDPLTTCTNPAGSRTCGACPTGYTGTGATSCPDFNECLTNNGGCDPLTTCTNTAGSRTCGACPTGYTGTGATACTDIDECLTNNGGCDPLTTCTNTAGSRTCGACPTGYTGTGATSCTDIDECLTNNGGCDPLTTCTNTAGSRTCGACPTGYVGSGATSCVLYRTSCYQYLQLGPSTGDGLYTIDTDGSGPNAPVQVYCDMTNGGWTQILDQDVAVSGGYLSSAQWRAGVATTAPNAGQWSILNRISELENSNLTFEFRMTYGTDQTNFIQWVQTGDPSTGTRGTLSNIVESPTNQSGCGPFVGLANDGQGESAWDGDAGGCWWFAVGSSGSFGPGGIPVVNGSDGGQIVTNRVRLYVRTR